MLSFFISAANRCDIFAFKPVKCVFYNCWRLCCRILPQLLLSFSVPLCKCSWFGAALLRLRLICVTLNLSANPILVLPYSSAHRTRAPFKCSFTRKLWDTRVPVQWKDLDASYLRLVFPAEDTDIILKAFDLSLLSMSVCFLSYLMGDSFPITFSWCLEPLKFVSNLPFSLLLFPGHLWFFPPTLS